MTNVQFFLQDKIDDRKIFYVTCAARYQEKWVYARHKDRMTWDMPGGHREAGETPLEAMERELWEETGALQANIVPINVYSVNGSDIYGMLFFADILQLGELPEDFEMVQLQFLDNLPQQQTYPDIYPALFSRIQGWLNLQSNPEELWDVYDENRNLTGRLHRRGCPLNAGDYHLVVHVWMCNNQGKFLLTKRSPNKGFPNLWETTGGSALAGDDSLSAALREVKEETGIALDPQKGKCILSTKHSDYFRDVWVFCQNVSLDQVILQPGETTDKMYADVSGILHMYADGELVPYDYLKELFDTGLWREDAVY